MVKGLIVILFLFLTGLQYQIWFGSTGYQKYWALQDRITQQKQENDHLKQRNTLLQAEVMDLKQGIEAIEERARLELGMIKRDEVFYQIVE